MSYLDTCILESDAPGVAGDDFDVVALMAPAGQVGASVANVFGLESDMATVVASVPRPITRLLMVVADPLQQGAVERVRAAVRWKGHAPF